MWIKIITSVVLAVFFLTNPEASFAQSNVIPSPLHYQKKEGVLPLVSISIDTNGVSSSIVNYFAFNLETYWGCKVKKTGSDGLIKFTRKEEVNEKCSFEISEEISVEYSTDEMAFAAVNTLLQLLKTDNQTIYWEKCEVYDAPQYRWRGLHLDVSRHFFTIEEVKRFIDLMALYKFNKFHWHLTDDQGWRIEIKKYPLLTEIGGFRDSTVIGHYGDSPRSWDYTRYGGFYTQEEIKEVVRHAADRFIDVIPEIEMPGHARAALAAYPELSCTGEQLPVEGLWGIFDDIYCSKAETISFLQDVLEEVIALFPSKFIHIGGDEAPKTRWKECPECQSVMHKNSLQNEHELQSYFIKQMDAFLTARGKKIIGWDEILEGGLSPNAAVMSWRGQEGGTEAAKQHHEVVMSPTTYCYFDYYQGINENEPLAIGGYLPLEKVFQFDPTPSDLSKEDAEYILGGQANLWTEYIPTIEQLEYMIYPRALALSQVLWCSDKGKYSSFLESVLNHQEDFLTRYHVNFAKSIHYPTIVVSRANEGISITINGVSENDKFDVIASKDDDSILFEKMVSREDTIRFKRSSESDRIHLIVKEVDEGLISSADFTLHENIGMSVELVTIPHPKYNHNGSLNLVDGIKGSLPWKGSEWLGFNTSDVEIILDSERKRIVNCINVGFLENNGSWIYVPQKIQIESSNNKKKWKESEVFNLTDLKIINGTYVIETNRKSRYIKVSISNMKLIPTGFDGAGNIPWTFIDEIEVKYKK